MTELLHIRAPRTGRCIGYLMPSTSNPGTFHTVTPRWCDCRGFAYRGHCRHQETVAEYVAAHTPPMPGSAVLDGLQALVAQRSAAYGRIFKAERED